MLSWTAVPWPVVVALPLVGVPPFCGNEEKLKVPLSVGILTQTALDPPWDVCAQVAALVQAEAFKFGSLLFFKVEQSKPEG